MGVFNSGIRSDMIKSELIDCLAAKLTHLPEQDVALGVNDMLDLMSEALVSGRRIEIRGFGSFSLHKQKPRRAHNPKTGEKIITKTKRSIHFKSGKKLKDHLEENRSKYPLEHDK
jgi:integration host factor subunit beta